VAAFFISASALGCGLNYAVREFLEMLVGIGTEFDLLASGILGIGQQDPAFWRMDFRRV
jgi:hypothetical protein